ncbi:MAG TPA: GyrI-like domain-containing protein, partial [Vicinamibacterales bacterium]|nr:GyrI-like domain-containing protein [Vicinamibacterales bacterium]
MDVTVVDRPELRIAGIRHIGPYPQIGRAFGSLGGILKGPPPAGSQMIALFHDDPATTQPDRLRSDAALTLPSNARTPDGLIEQRVPAGRYARAVHKGSYEGL